MHRSFALLLALTSLGALVQSAPEATPPSAPPTSAPAAQQPASAPAEAPAAAAQPEPEKKKEHWYDRLSLRGYTQLRYNRLPSFDVNDDLVNAQGDRFLGRNTGFGIRRARVVISGDVFPWLSVYLQPDFASTLGDQLDVAIMRDWYADIFLDAKKEFRFRVGQSKIPFGFENLQSSSNRLPLDRADALGASRDERDLGIMFYWAPEEIRHRFKLLVDENLKGSGDYGVVGLGVYNGQGANNPERNDDRHYVARLAWPFQFGKQFVEVNLAGYYGRYAVPTATQDGTTFTFAEGNNNVVDSRGAVSLIVYPQPLGFQAEYTMGVGPEQGTGAESTVIASRRLQGGYAQVMYKIDGLGRSLIPYARFNAYDGGRKLETNTPRSHVREFEVGAEWQANKWLELTLAYAFSNRTASKAPYPQERGQLTRVQLQFNY